MTGLVEPANGGTTSIEAADRGGYSKQRLRDSGQMAGDTPLTGPLNGFTGRASINQGMLTDPANNFTGNLNASSGALEVTGDGATGNTANARNSLAPIPRTIRTLIVSRTVPLKMIQNLVPVQGV